MKRRNKPASVYTALRIPPDLLEEAKRRAARDGRSLSNYIRNLIRRDLSSEKSKRGR
jgi:plasmid stability protein